MKQIMEFNLPKDREKLDDAYHGAEWKLVAWQMREYLFRALKDAEEEEAVLKNVLDEFNGWLEDYKLYL